MSWISDISLNTGSVFQAKENPVSVVGIVQRISLIYFMKHLEKL